MRVLVACEFSGRVRDAFRALGADAWSCDLEDTEASPTWHIRDDVRNHLDRGWDLMIAHPPCRYLAVSGARWFAARQREQQAAIDFARTLWDAPIPRIALENPVSILSTHLRKPDQIVHPWQFGHGETKATCLWLRGLPLLVPTDIVTGRHPAVLLMGESKKRRRDRARTYTGIAAAMAAQWGM